MPSFNKVILMGNLTRDPELRFLPNNTPVLDIGLAVNDRRKNKQTNEWEDETQFVDCTAFGRNAENIDKHFSKGTPIFIEGSLKFEQWEDRQTGQKRSKLKVLIGQWKFIADKRKDGDGSPQSSGYQDRAYGNSNADMNREPGW